MGKLVFLKTQEELRAEAAQDTVDVYIVEVPARAASGALLALKTVPDYDPAFLGHTRRFIKPTQLPPRAAARLDEARRIRFASHNAQGGDEQTPEDRENDERKKESREAHIVASPAAMTPAAASSSSDIPITHAGTTPSESSTAAQHPDYEILCFLVCTTALIYIEDLEILLTPVVAAVISDFSLAIATTPVPLYAPTSVKIADFWTQNYWPTMYKKTNPHGPHPNVISRNEIEIQDEVQQWMQVASDAAQMSVWTSAGLSIGCVIVDRKEGAGQAVAIAGDARFHDWKGVAGDECPSPISTHDHESSVGSMHSSNESNAVAAEHTGCASENHLAHAVIRAIGMVARKRLRDAENNPPASLAVLTLNSSKPPPENLFLDTPINPLEQTAFDADNAPAAGYLCHKLEIYVNAEPCVMCSMAILHSRFGRCVFGSRRPLTGGLSADEPGLGYGLGWRTDLNWKLLVWQWLTTEEGEHHEEELREDIQV